MRPAIGMVSLVMSLFGAALGFAEPRLPGPQEIVPITVALSATHLTCNEDFRLESTAGGGTYWQPYATVTLQAEVAEFSAKPQAVTFTAELADYCPAFDSLLVQAAAKGGRLTFLAQVSEVSAGKVSVSLMITDDVKLVADVSL